jgi:adiponectin receptor
MYALPPEVLNRNRRLCPKYHPYRAFMYSGLGLSFIIPIVHGLILFGLKTQMWRMSLDWLTLMTVFNLTGGELYALRVCSQLSA